MRRCVWALAAWMVERTVPAEHLAHVLGDLAEDLDRRERTRGPLRSTLWLLRECLSLAGSYRSEARRHRRIFSRRAIMGGSWRDDSRFAWRRLRKRPLGAVASVLTLACAIGAGSATWSLFSSLLLHPLPIDVPERLFAVTASVPMRDGRVRASSHFLYPQYRAIRDSVMFTGLAAGYAFELLVGTGETAVPQRRVVAFASHDYFDTLGVRMQAGREFMDHEDQRGAAVPAVISDRIWRAAFNRDPAVIGRELTFVTRTTMTAPATSERATIVGIAPRGFRGLNLAEAPDVYVPLHAIATLAAGFSNPFSDKDPRNSPSSWIGIVGRLEDGALAEQIEARLEQLRLGTGVTFELIPVNTAAIPELARAGMVRFVRLLATTVALLLLIGSLTVGVLLMVRTEARRDELAMCLALGGTRLSLVRGIVLEGAMLSAAGALLAVPVAAWLFAAARRFELPGGVDLDLLGLSIDRRVWVACAIGAVAATLMTALLAGAFGFAPRVADVLRSRAGGTPRVTRRRTRAALVIAQVAVALVLVAGAGLFARSLAAALTLNSGFDAGRIVTAVVSLDSYGYMPARAASFFVDLRARLIASPAIESAALIQREGAMTTYGRIIVNGDPRQFPSIVAYTAVDERYFPTMGMRVLAGRDFSDRDTASAPLVVIVSESFARQLAPGGSPLGMRITETSRRPPAAPGVAEVIGVVPDVITSVAATEPLAVYYSLAQREPSSRRTVVARARADAAPVAAVVAGTINQLDPGVEPGPVLSIEEQLARQMSPQQLGIFVLGGLGAIAVLLTLLGAYVLAESMASTRTREMSIRAALGARRMQLGSLVVRETVVLIGAGLVAGLALAWLGANSIRAFLFRVEPLDFATLGAVSLGILALGVIVSLRPAFDAARVDLAHVLRDE
jgi:predicted permease